MIEAVNSVVANSSLLRGNAEQVSTVQSSANTEAVAQAPRAPYISPYISVDNRFDTAVIQIRDSDTGDVLTQFPSEPTLQSRQRAEALQRAQEAVAERALTATSAEREVAAPTSVETVTIAQAEAPAQAQGAGVAQAAIAALSTGAQSGQAVSGNVSVTA